ncbi:hypothetical protein NDU88_002678 [Pleurodeles waltl]|uniref:Uncharacterized protein n=1 Tax=Pleurodeles waltl TaxID=8319 RepID=A0AAV7VDZ3_PLEWA|nr:hypothetical protein NDU88_002678 [Pleurodeles waltl]
MLVGPLSRHKGDAATEESDWSARWRAQHPGGLPADESPATTEDKNPQTHPGGFLNTDGAPPGIAKNRRTHWAAILGKTRGACATKTVFEHLEQEARGSPGPPDRNTKISFALRGNQLHQVKTLREDRQVLEMAEDPSDSETRDSTDGTGLDENEQQYNRPPSREQAQERQAVLDSITSGTNT